MPRGGVATVLALDEVSVIKLYLYVAVKYQCYRDAKTAFSFVFSDLGHAGLVQAPDMHLAVDTATRQV